MSIRSRFIPDYPASALAGLITESSVLIQPLGSIEQHGDHLPLSTDLVVVDAYTRALVDEYGEALDLWMLPPLPYTKSNEHSWAPGTIWLSPETLLATMRDVGRSLAMLPARRLVFLNGHGGNTSLLDVVCRELRLAHGFLTFLLHPALPADHGGEGHPDECGLGIHGGVSETSVLMHIRPDLVHMDAAATNVPLWLQQNKHVRFGGSAGFGWVSTDFGPSGVIGDPTLATVEQGKQMFEDGIAFLGEALAEIAAFEFPDGLPVVGASRS